MNRLILVTLFCLFAVTSVVEAKPDLSKAVEGLVKVHYATKKGEFSVYGIVVAKEVVVTTRLPSKSKVSVKKIDQPALLPSEVLILGEDYPLVALKVVGLDAKPVTFQNEVKSGQTIYAMKKESKTDTLELVTGSISDLIEYQPIKKSLLNKKNWGPKLDLFIHNALFSDSAIGTPLLNECGEFIGLSIKEPWEVDSIVSQRVALRGAQMKDWLGSIKVVPSVAKSNCKGAQARVIVAEEKIKIAKEELEKAQAKAKAKAQKDKKAKEAAEKEAEEAQQKLEDLKIELEDAKRHAEFSKGELTDQIKLIAVGGMLLLLALLLLWRLHLRKKNKILIETNNRAIIAEQAAVSARQQVAAVDKKVEANFDCVLHGSDPEGKNHMIKIHKGVLADNEGIVLGRNPRGSKFIISHEEVGREHARIFYNDGSLFVEDLNSTNGTYVNGNQLVPNQKTLLLNGSELRLGPINFKVELV